MPLIDILHIGTTSTLAPASRSYPNHSLWHNGIVGSRSSLRRRQMSPMYFSSSFANREMAQNVVMDLRWLLTSSVFRWNYRSGIVGNRTIAEARNRATIAPRSRVIWGRRLWSRGPEGNALWDREFTDKCTSGVQRAAPCAIRTFYWKMAHPEWLEWAIMAQRIFFWFQKCLSQVSMTIRSAPKWQFRWASVKFIFIHSIIDSLTHTHSLTHHLVLLQIERWRKTLWLTGVDYWHLAFFVGTTARELWDTEL